MAPIPVIYLLNLQIKRENGKHNSLAAELKMVIQEFCLFFLLSKVTEHLSGIITNKFTITIESISITIMVITSATESGREILWSWVGGFWEC